MSSHHIVRDKQEPALLLATPEACSFEQASQLLEWSPVVMALPEALPEALSWQIKLDIALLSSTSSISSSDLEFQQPIQILQPSGNLLSFALSHLAEKNHKAVNISLQAGSFAQSEEILSTYAQKLDIVVYSQLWKQVFVRGGKFEKWLTEGSVLQFNATITQTKNLRQLSDGQWQVLQNGIVAVTGSKSFWLAEMIA